MEFLLGATILAIVVVAVFASIIDIARHRFDDDAGDNRTSSTASVMAALAPFYDPGGLHLQEEIRRQQDERDDEEDGAPPRLEFSNGRVRVIRPRD